MDDDSAADLRPRSDSLRELGDQRRDVTLAELVERFDNRAFGAVLFLFAVACALPLPPGSSTILGAPLVLLAPQVAMGSRTPWLPRGVRDRTLDAATLRHVSVRLAGLLERVERVSRPRLKFLFGEVGGRMIGVVCTLLALVLILPIPLGNVLPAAAVAAFSLALVLRDGALAILGYVLTLASTAVLVIAARIVIGFVQQFVRTLPVP